MSFDYQGECEYVLVEKCSDSDEVPYFKLVGQHNKQAPNDIVSYLKYLRLEYGEDRYEMFVNGRVHVNGIRVNMPYSYGDVEIRETIPGYTVSIWSNFWLGKLTGTCEWRPRIVRFWVTENK